jgi:biopolymer transport protein ExbD
LPPLPTRSPVEASLPLINVVFLLLLFFVVTGTIVYQHDRSIVPPTSILLNPGKAPADAVYISAEGTLSFRGIVQGPAEIAEVLRTDAEAEGAGDAGARTLRLVADHRLKARALLAIVEDFKEQDLDSLSIVTVRDTGR